MRPETATVELAVENGSLNEVFESACDRTPGSVALECDGQRFTYAELDARANQLAHHLAALGAGPGSRVAIWLPRSVQTYVSLLAVGKAGAAFVPIDPGAPPDRVSYIIEDSGADLVLTVSALAGQETGLGKRVLELDLAAGAIAAHPITRPGTRRAPDPQAPAYVMYTSGSTGRPKGVAVSRAGIRNFLSVVAPIYDVRPQDRVYQGMTISFDFSIEEIWPTWAAGATLVAGPSGAARLGAELADFLEQKGITVLYCVPTLLATIPRDLPRLRAIMVGGEACPAQLVQRWARPGRRMLNTYGPTEATVTATWCELRPGRPVTIGRPLPTYSVVLLDENRAPVPHGQVGEICIGGPGVALGYVGRPELTADRFIAHPGHGRLYRTGDLGRLTPDGEIEYLGRADTEVKIRGHRVDLTEIDSLVLELPDVAAAVTSLTPDGELVLHVVAADGDVDLERAHDSLRERLPGYMVPSFVDILARLPMMPSGKVDRAALPAPSGRRLTGSGPVTAPADELERRVRECFARALGTAPESVSVDADFFSGLGGHSLLAARVVSLLREQDFGARVAVRDLYEHPSIRALAGRLRSAGGRVTRSAERPRPLRHNGKRVATAGLTQSVFLYLLLLVLTLPVSYALTGTVVQGPVPTTLACVAGFLVIQWILPVLLARPLAAGIRLGRYPLWGWTYLRLWALDLVLSVSPLPLLRGSPFLPPYLRLLGAKVGRRTTIATSALGLPALLRIGDGASLGYGVSLQPWRVEDGWVIVGGIELGPRAFVGTNSVLEPGARIEADAALGEHSALGPDQVVPAGTCWAGSPGGPVDGLAGPAEAMLRRRQPVRGWRPHHIVAALGGLVLVEAVQMLTVLPCVLLASWALANWGPFAGALATIVGGPVYVLTVCAAVAAGKRLVLPRTPRGIQPAFSLTGVRKWVSDSLFGLSLTLTNSLYATLYTPPWLRLLGARIGPGCEVSTAAQIDPDLLALGEGSFVADMAAVGPAAFAGGWLCARPTEVGTRAFVGNAALVPAGTSVPNGALVGVSSIAPPGGADENTSWLGSPAMYLPARQPSASFPEEQTFRPTRGAVRHRLFVEFFRATLPASLLGTAMFGYLVLLRQIGATGSMAAAMLLAPLLAAVAGGLVILFCAAAKRVLIGRYRPRVEPLWSRWVRRTELVTGLYETAAVPAGIAMLAGTPFLPVALRLFGARIGKRVWLGTTYLTEFDLVEIGDDAAVAGKVSLQTHLFEDRVMKMAPVLVRSGANVGTRSVVLYDSVVGDEVTLGALSLVMKGERLTEGTSWQGIPAQPQGA